VKLGIVYTFAPDSGAGTGSTGASGGSPDASGTPAAQTTTPDAAAGGTTPAGQTPATTPPVGEATGGQESKTFTQADVDRIITERLDRVTKKYGDLDTLKSKAEKADELEKAQMTAQQRAEAERDEATKRAVAAEELARSRTIQLALTTLLSKDHPQYLGREKYIVPLIDIKPDADDDAIVASVTAAVKQFVQDVPLAPQNGGGNREAGGSPPGERRNGSPNNGGSDATKKLIAANFLLTSPIGGLKFPDQA
jgi:hypothetical protein